VTKPSTPVAQARLSATHPSAGRQRRTSAEYQKLPGRPQRIPGIFPGWKEDRTTADVLSKLTWNKELIGVLAAQWGNYGLPPQQSSFAVHATIAHHYFEGASYPVGGASRIAETIAPVI
jgi:phytoene dehydrogenase-like protein